MINELLLHMYFSGKTIALRTNTEDLFINQMNWLIYRNLSAQGLPYQSFSGVSNWHTLVMYLFNAFKQEQFICLCLKFNFVSSVSFVLITYFKIAT